MDFIRHNRFNPLRKANAVIDDLAKGEDINSQAGRHQKRWSIFTDGLRGLFKVFKKDETSPPADFAEFASQHGLDEDQIRMLTARFGAQKKAYWSMSILFIILSIVAALYGAAATFFGCILMAVPTAMMGLGSAIDEWRFMNRRLGTWKEYMS